MRGETGNMVDYLLQDFKYTSISSIKPKSSCRTQIFNNSHVYVAADFSEELSWVLLSFLLWAPSPHLWFLIKYPAKNCEIFWNSQFPADNRDCCLEVIGRWKTGLIYLFFCQAELGKTPGFIIVRRFPFLHLNRSSYKDVDMQQCPGFQEKRFLLLETSTVQFCWE